MNENTVKQAIAPLRMIFWGGLLCIFDITFSTTTNGVGFKFDLLNDVLGAVLIAVGVFRLSTLPVHSRYAAAMRFVQVVSVLYVFDTIREVFIMPQSGAVQFIVAIFGLVALAATVVFCTAMRWFCEDASLIEAARSWSVTTILFVVIYLLPLGLLYAISAVAIATGASFNLNLGPAILLVLPVFAIPIVHLFVSTSRMKRSAEAA